MSALRVVLVGAESTGKTTLTNALLAEQVSQLTQERDSLRSRLQAARARVDALIERLPVSETAKDDAP